MLHYRIVKDASRGENTNDHEELPLTATSHSYALLTNRSMGFS